MADQFFTRVNIPESPVKMDYHTKVLFMGSCFSDYIGRIMASYKFPVLLNPFGTLFNPISIADDLLILKDRKVFTEADLGHFQDVYFSFAHYTGFSDVDPQRCLKRINESATQASEWLKNCSYLIITLGTSWVYTFNASGKVVANCHKLPGSDFTKSLLSPGEIIKHYNRLIPQLRLYNPGLRIVFTLSPVRHWADGAESNQLSKSILHYSIHELIALHKDLFYFPAYEIFMDELRDYRFYAVDMLHPSEQGTRYVWDRFAETWLDKQSREIIPELEQVIKSLAHKPVNAESAAHLKFMEKTQKKIEALKTRYPFLDFS
jgi:hypothetical protein